MFIGHFRWQVKFKVESLKEKILMKTTQFFKQFSFILKKSALLNFVVEIFFTGKVYNNYFSRQHSSLVRKKYDSSKLKFSLMKSSKKYFIFLPAFYLIMLLMISPKFENIAISKIWHLVFFWGVKTHFGMDKVPASPQN